MSESRQFGYFTDSRGPAEDRSFAACTFLWSRVKEVGYSLVGPDKLALTAVRLSLREHKPNDSVTMTLGRGGLWLATIKGAETEPGVAWERYQDFVEDMERGAVGRFAIEAEKAVAAEGERTTLAVKVQCRTEARKSEPRYEFWQTTATLHRTFGPEGKPGICIRQRQASEYELLRGHTVDLAVYSDYSFWRATAGRQTGARLRSAPDTWAAELEHQFSPRVPIKALTPSEWRLVVDTPFTEADVMTEQR